MNIFVLDTDPAKAAQMQCDKHVVKMIVESAQMLSTAHRLLDGEMGRKKSKSGKTTVKSWTLPDERDSILYQAVHVGHPCTVWTTESAQNYTWHYFHFIALCEEYRHRYGKTHQTDTLLSEILSRPPNNIRNTKLTPFALAMKANPECINEAYPVASYRKFYQTKQLRFNMRWTNREIPEWFVVRG